MSKIFNGNDRAVIQGQNWIYKLASDDNKIVLITFSGVLSDGNYLPENNWVQYVIHGYAEIEELDALDLNVQKGLREKNFIPTELIWAINQRGIMLRQYWARLEGHFSFEIHLGDHVLSLYPMLEGQVPDKINPDLWYATAEGFGNKKVYVVNSNYLNEQTALNLVQNLPDKQFVVEVL